MDCISYTVGQRRGLGFSVGRPIYVVAVDRANNRLIVGDDSELRRSDLRSSRRELDSVRSTRRASARDVRIRNRHEPAEAEITPLEQNTARISFADRSGRSLPGRRRCSTTEKSCLAVAGSRNREASEQERERAERTQIKSSSSSVVASPSGRRRWRRKSSPAFTPLRTADT